VAYIYGHPPWWSDGARHFLKLMQKTPAGYS